MNKNHVRVDNSSFINDDQSSTAFGTFQMAQTTYTPSNFGASPFINTSNGFGHFSPTPFNNDLNMDPEMESY